MATTDLPSTGKPGASPDAINQRRPTLAQFSFERDPRLLRALLQDISEALDSSHPSLRHEVRLLISEIVGRLLRRCPEVTVQLDLVIKADSVRVDVAETGGDCDFWGALDDPVFTDLTSGWGRDRRGSGGAWFEISAPSAEVPIAA